MILLLFLAQLSYQQDVAPIINRNCISCHKQNEIAPFPLTTYEEVRKHAKQIAEVTESRYMPPWLPAGHAFKDERRLTKEEIGKLTAWSKDPTEGNEAPAHGLGIEQAGPLGPSDLTLQVPTPYTVPAEGPDVFRNFIIPIPPGDVHYVRAIEIDPGNRKLVHHANIIQDRTRSLRYRDAKDGQPGFPGMDVTTESGNTFSPDSHFLFWKPGSPTEEEPSSQSWRLDPDTDLILNLHLRPSGKLEVIQPKITLYYAKSPPTEFPMLLQLEHDGAIHIPPNSHNATIEDHLTLPVSVDLLRIYPHAHYLGKHIEAWAQLPNRTRKELIDIPNWNLDWQGVFTYREPIHLPKGTTVYMRITYDNPTPHEVRTGDKASDEMGHVWLQVLPREKSETDPRLPLQEATMQRRLEKYPTDYVAHYNLGALYTSESRNAEATEQLEAAVKIDPAQPAGRNALAVALSAEGRNADALKQWRETIRLNPIYSEAHYNLARALTVLDDTQGAIAEYRIYLQQVPNDAAAHLNLGNIYIQLKQFPQAVPEYAQACELDPTNSNALTDYGTLLARTGNLAEAIKTFQSALSLDPNNQTAARNLERARGSLH